MANSLRIAHFVVDDKFTSRAFELFEAVACGCNDYYLITTKNHFKYLDLGSVIKVSPYKVLCPGFSKRLQKYSFIVLHSLSFFNLLMLSLLKVNVPIVWIGMGFDYYDLIYVSDKKYFQDKTLSLVRNYSGGKGAILSYDNIRSAIICIHSMFYPKREVIKKISYFSPVLEPEYSMVFDQSAECKTKYIKWNYGSASKALLKYKDQKVKGDNILLGNSASFTNNHVEAIDILSKCDKLSGSVICPLSYSNSSSYVTYVSQYGSAMLGEKFMPLINFMPYDDYVQFLLSCSVVIMNHHRQQGAASVAMALYFGAKVYINLKNPMYKYYADLGVKMFSIDGLNGDPLSINDPLSAEEKKNNSEIILLEASSDASIRKTENLIKVICEGL